VILESVEIGLEALDGLDGHLDSVEGSNSPDREVVALAVLEDDVEHVFSPRGPSPH